MTYFVDCEASSVMPGTFPIEVGWVDQDGVGESHLIRPTPEWLNPPGGPMAWSPESEALHGISLEMLLREGKPIEAVARRVAEVLSPRHVLAVSDHPPADGRWLNQLLLAGGIRRRITLIDTDRLYAMACRPLMDLMQSGEGPGWIRAEDRIRSMAPEIVSAALEAERVRQRARHRALPDAESHWRVWCAVREGVARRLAEERT